MNKLLYAAPLLFSVAAATHANVNLEQVDSQYYVVPTGDHSLSSPAPAGFDEHFDATLDPSDGSLISPMISESYSLGTSSAGSEPRITPFGNGETATSETAFPLDKNANYGLTADFTETYNSTLEVKNLADYLVHDGARPGSVFVSYYVKIDHISGEESRNIKLLRLTSGYNGAYLQPTVGVTLFHNNSSAIFYNYYGNGDHNLKWVKMPKFGEWTRIDYYVKMSSTKGASDGEIALYYDGNKITEMTNVITNNTDNFFDWATLPYYVAKDPGGSYNMHSDSVAIIPSYRRIEACRVKDFSSVKAYSDCDNPIVLAPKAESVGTSSTIGLTHEKLTADNVDKLILYYFDDQNNLVNPEGLQFCPRCPV